jgi:superfamily I DNA/RNA helicase
MPALDHKAERDADLKNIRDSRHPRKVVVAGPGTGKSYLFSEIIKKKRAEGKTNFLAITFIGKLVDALADDLCGLATTNTLHAFARGFVLGHGKTLRYYPKIYDLIEEDLRNEGIGTFEVGDNNYLGKTKYYKAVGDADVVHYAIQICKKDPKKIPVFDLVLVDEYQDFNEKESEFVDILAQKNEIVIVGDDDQALYTFKHASPSFIRAKYDSNNTNWESFTLRFCSRCTEVLVRYFHGLVAKFAPGDPADNDPAKKRIEKEFVCYAPEKADDSRANPKVHLIKNCPVGMIAKKIWYELKKLVESQKVKEILIIGEARSCKALLRSIAQQLKSYGFNNVDLKDEGGIISVRQNIVDAYKLLAEDKSSLLGWRILGNPTDADARERHIKNANTLDAIINGTPSKVGKVRRADILLLEDEIEDWGTAGNECDGSGLGVNKAEDLKRREQDTVIRNGLLTQELKRANLHLPRPLCNLEIAVCNILNSKGLGADVVFLVGFDQGKFPSKSPPMDDEIYQMMVAATRARKRLYLINTIDYRVSGFVDCLDSKYLQTEEIKPKPSKSASKSPLPKEPGAPGPGS